MWDEDSGQCVPGCETDADCPSGQTCEPVWCVTVPCYPQCMAPACTDAADCGEGQWCDEGTCREEGTCDEPADCDAQGLPHVMCVGAWSCEQNTCAYHCDTLPVQACTAVPDGQWGACRMLMGVVWNGTECVYASGCGCDPAQDPLCQYIYPDFESCEAATAGCPGGPLL